MNMKEIAHHMENKYTSTTTADKDLSMLSLFDYLGHAAGIKLGEQVSKASAKQNIPVSTREISNPKYKGKVMLYPKWFLDQYFNTPNQSQTKEEFKLPF